MCCLRDFWYHVRVAEHSFARALAVFLLMLGSARAKVGETNMKPIPEPIRTSEKFKMQRIRLICRLHR